MKEIEVCRMRAKIELTRIDNRLVHGQVGMTWGSTLNIDTMTSQPQVDLHRS